MMMPGPLTYIGPDAPAALSAFARERGLTRFDLLADVNTWEALGQQAAVALAETGAAVRPIILPGDVIADEDAIMQVLLQAREPDRALVAVGSGTLTDIGRFVSHRSGRVFISLPTAPSVDAYSSINSPLVVRRLKETINAHAPVVIFADLDVLCAAPPDMIAAGYGDILAKYVCLADWRLGQLLWGEDLDEPVVEAMQQVLAAVAPQAESIGRAEPNAIAALMGALVASGNAMAAVGSSRPASGAEHHISHYLEMRLLQTGRPPVLHGAKVGAATLLIASAYQRLANLTRDEVAHLLAADAWPSATAQRAEIRAAYGDIAEQVIASHRGFIELDQQARRAFYQRILARWPEVQALACTVPAPALLADWLARAGGSTSLTALAFSEEEVQQAVQVAHYIRDRFTVRQLDLALGLEALHRPSLRLE